MHVFGHVCVCVTLLCTFYRFFRNLSEVKQADIRKECLKQWGVSIGRLTQYLSVSSYAPQAQFHSLNVPLCLTLQIPDRARVTPAPSDPKTKFYELMKVRHWRIPYMRLRTRVFDGRMCLHAFAFLNVLTVKSYCEHVCTHHLCLRARISSRSTRSPPP